MNKSHNRLQRIIEFFGSKTFFWCVVGLLIVQAGWIAWSGRYPMAFDEDFHLGIIKLYASHLNPFWNGQVNGGDAFGAVARDPSYLYHYLMSFPYRLISWLVSDLRTEVLILRFMNIGFFAAGLVIYRRLLSETKASTPVVNLCLLILVLLPITPLLAAQINYDNVFIPLAGLALLLTIRLVKRFDSKRLGVHSLLILLALCLFTSLVKYAFLPIFIAIGLFVAVGLYKKYRGFKQFKMALFGDFKHLNAGLLAGLIILNLLLGGLFIERYGINLVKYHTPVADCADVLDYSHCRYYGPWIRDYNFKQQKIYSDPSPVVYSYQWLRGMWFRTFFAVDGPATRYETRGPMTIPGLSAIVFAVFGVVAFTLTAKRIWQKYDRASLWLMVSTSLLYIAVLWQEEYRMYLETGRPVAINGRYLLPILPFFILLIIFAIKELTLKRRRLQIAIVAIVLLCLAWGGGAMTYVLRSNDAWYWQYNSQVKAINHALKNSFGPLTPGYDKPTQYLP